MDAHEWTVHINNLRCDKCTFQTGKSEELEAHAITHSEKVYFKCSKCDDQFENKQTLEEHMKTHSTTVYQCEECELQVQSKAELKTHKETAHPVASTQCQDKCKKMKNYFQITTY